MTTTFARKLVRGAGIAASMGSRPRVSRFLILEIESLPS
jgi:hypothetical protein